jgi:hypothetical protein
VTVIKPRNYFDDFVMRTVVQAFCDRDGIRIALVKTAGPAKLKQPATPDVEFLPPGEKVG